MPLELIAYFQGETEGAKLCVGVTSPGDWDGDGFSELFVGEMGLPKRLLVFNGGNPPDTIPDWIVTDGWRTHMWIPDINGDGIRDFGLHKSPLNDLGMLDIYFGGSDVYTKTEPDITFTYPDDSIAGFGYRFYSGDVNGDSQNDLIVTSGSRWIPDPQAWFHIFYGGDVLDIIEDSRINIHRTEEYSSYLNGIALGDINGDGLVDYAYTMVHISDVLRKLHIILGNIPLDTLPTYIISPPYEVSTPPGNFGMCIYPLGDINKDDYDDFALGSSDLWPCIFYGGSPFDTVPVVLGDTANADTKGTAVANVGDINDDGWDDIGVGYTALDLGNGIAYVYYGSRTIDTEADLAFPWYDAVPMAGGYFGYSIGPAGDFNGDGVDDLVISAEQKWAYQKGQVWVYAGDSTLPTPAEEVDDPFDIPRQFDVLEQNYPNPFNTSTTIRYHLSGRQSRRVELSIYNLLGQRVRVLRDRIEGGGVHSANWDGTDDNGAVVSTGIYFSVFKSDGQATSKKMLLLK